MNMMRHARRPKSAFTLDALDARRSFDAAPWGAVPTLLGLAALQDSAPGVTGAGQTVAVIDTGVDYTNASLGGGFGAGFKVIGGYDFADDDADPMDTDGHGTAVAGVVAASRFESGGFTYQGVAPDARLVALRIAADTASVPLGRIRQALDWVLTNAAQYGITVVNLSFGYGTFDSDYADSTLTDDLARLDARGIAFVASSGNNGLNNGPGITYPAADSTAISVGSVKSNGAISEFTQRSTNLDLLAPGEGVVTTKRGGGYGTFFGTSFAAPAASGTIALLRGVDPTFTLGDVASMFRASSLANHDGDDETGETTGYDFRQLDVDRTVRLALQRRAATPGEQADLGADASFNRTDFDAQGVEHLVYFDDVAQTMLYATRSLNGAWSAPITIDTTTPSAGTEFSLRLDSRGRPKLAFLDGPNGDLKFARFDDAAWAVETLDSKGVAGQYPSLVIDATDKMYVSYFRKTNFDLRVTSYDPADAATGWSRQTIDTDGSVGWSTNIALDAAGQPGVAYGDETRHRLKLARRQANGTWSIQTVEQGVRAASISLAFDPINRPRVSYYELDSADLKFAASDGNQWTVQRIASKGATGLYTNLCLDEAGSGASILYWDRRTNSIFRAAGVGDGSSRWTLSRLRDGGGKYLSASKRGDVWTYAASGDGKLLFGTA